MSFYGSNFYLSNYYRSLFYGEQGEELLVPVDVNDPIAQLLLNDANVTNKLKVFNINEHEMLNFDADLTPWIGIYRENEVDEGAIFNRIVSWDKEEKIKILTQASSYESGEKCEQSLEALNDSVIGAIINDTSILNSVEMVKEFDIEYIFDYSERESIHFQTSAITLTTVKGIEYS